MYLHTSNPRHLSVCSVKYFVTLGVLYKFMDVQICKTYQLEICISQSKINQFIKYRVAATL